MRIFSNSVEAVREVERDLWEMGIEIKTTSVQDLVDVDGYKAKELQGYSFTLLNGEDWRQTFRALGYPDEEDCIHYVEQELTDRINSDGLNPGFAWQQRKMVWSQFLHEGKFSYTYSNRIHKHFFNSQWDSLSRIHKVDPESRQLILQIYDHRTDGNRRLGMQRIPCTMYYQFLQRGEDLILIHNMRSCDLYKHFPIDLALSWKMCEEQATIWHKKPRVIMQIGSLHAFVTDMERRNIF